MPERTNNWWIGAALVTSVIVGGACGPTYYKVSTRLVTGSHADRPEVTTTSAYQSEGLQVTQVAVLAPDECSNDLAANSRGTGRGARAVIRLRCGVEMMLLERELAAAGYQVFSWRVVAEMVNREEHITSLEAARLLGADVVFQINSLEKAIGRVNKDARWERHFFDSSASGERGLAAVVDAGLARNLESLVGDEEHAILGANHLSVTADASVVRADTGQVIWFYHWTKLDDAAAITDAAVLVACKGGKCARAKAPVERQAKSKEAARSGGMEAISLAGQPLSRQEATYYQLSRSVVKDMVVSFTGAVPVAERNPRPTRAPVAASPAASSPVASAPVAVGEIPSAP